MSRKVNAQRNDSTSTVKTPTSQTPDFTSSLEPLISWMRLVGVPLGVKYAQPKWWGIWLGCYSLTFFALNLAYNFISLWLFFNQEDISYPANRVLSWNTALSTSNFCVNVIGNNVTLLAITSVRWEKLVTALDRLQTACIFQIPEHKLFRKKCSWALVTIVSVTNG